MPRRGGRGGGYDSYDGNFGNPPSSNTRELLCSTCGASFPSFYKGRRAPICNQCKERALQDKERACRARTLLGAVLTRRRANDIARFVEIACGGDARLLGSALREEPRLSRLLTKAHRGFSCHTPLLTHLCAQHDPAIDMDETFLRLIQLVFTALPSVVVGVPETADNIWHDECAHPVDLLCRGDPNFETCRDALLGDVRWTRELHPLLPLNVRQTYVLVARVLWRWHLHADVYLDAVASFLPPTFANKSSSFLAAHRTILETAQKMGVRVTAKLWAESTLEGICFHLPYVSPRQLADRDFMRVQHIDFVDAALGCIEVDERRSSGRGQVRRSPAFDPTTSFKIAGDIRKRVVTLGPISACLLDLPVHSKLALTPEEGSELREVARLHRDTPDKTPRAALASWMHIMDDETPVDVAMGKFRDDAVDDFFDAW